MWWGALWHLLGLVAEAGPAGALAGVLVIAVLAAGVLVTHRTAAAPGVAGLVLRTRAERAGVPRHRDPDAPGRTRPRGPTATLAAA